jgi:TolB protein
MWKKYFKSIIAFWLLLCLKPALAQLKIEITGVGSNQFPITIAKLHSAEEPPQDIAAIIRSDLDRSGVFRVVNATTVEKLTEITPIQYPAWKAAGTDALLTGSISRLANGRYDIRFALHDVIKQSTIGTQSIVVPAHQLRQTAHLIADFIYKKITGESGVFSTRIAYVSKNNSRYELIIADADGEGAQVALTSKEPIISPKWSPDGARLAYVSFEVKKPVIYIHSLASGQRTVLANYKGNNSAPSWSPDGGKLAFVLTRDGNSQIYMANADGSNLRRLTNTTGIETEPVFAQDGQSIYFTSDRSGGPQIYNMPISGGGARRITFNGNYNISPRISPDGKKLAFITRREGQFKLATIDLETSEEQTLTNNNNDESPSFSANGRMIMFATEMGGKGVLSVTSIDGRIKQRLSMPSSDIREPSWGPFLK